MNTSITNAGLTFSLPVPSPEELHEKLTLSPYERSAVASISKIKNPKRNFASEYANMLHRPFDRAGNALFESPAGEKAGVVLANILNGMQRGVLKTVRKDAILDDFGGSASSLHGIGALSLKRVDGAAKGLARKYRVAATVEGTLVGAVGAVGVAVDIPLVLSLAIRGASEVSAYYGFVPNDPRERAYVLDLISTAAAPTLEKRQKNLASLDAHAMSISANQRHEVGTMFTIQVVERVAEAVASRMAQGKAAQAVPLVGALIGGGFNRWFVGQVMSLAVAMYRERFLARKYGETAVTPAKPFSELA